MIQSFYRIQIVSCLVLCSSLLSASSVAPVNDSQCSATLLMMTNPDSCPSWDIDTVTHQGNNLTATSDTLPSFFLNCQSGGNTPNNPLADVWYKFVAPAERVAIVVSGLGTNSATLYLRQTTCMGLLPINCDVSSTGPAVIYCDVMLPGEIYYLQVSGGSLTDQGQFNMNFLWQHPCDDCVQNAKLIANPPPVNGYYHPGDTVEFTYIVNGYKPFGMDLFHGLSPDFSSGWDIASLTPMTTPPTQPASGVGTWAWYNGILDFSNNPVNGFFYDGPPTQNNDPSDNKGDFGTVFSQWIFRWKIRTNTICTGLEDLSINMYHYSDFETGSGTDPSCKYDVDYHFKATLNCCAGPDVWVTNATCSSGPTGTAIINIPTLPGPYSCTLYDQGGNIVFTSNNQASSLFTIAGLSQGDYVAIVNNNICFSSREFHISSVMEFTPLQTSAACGNTCGITASMTGQSTSGCTFLWMPSNQTTSVATNLCQGTHTIVVSNLSLGCVDTFYLQVFNYPSDIPFFVYNAPSTPDYCTIDTINPRPYFIAQPGGTFSWTGPPGNIDPVTGEIFLFPFITGGTYVVTYTTAGPCTATRSDSLLFIQSPPSPAIAGPTSFCLDQQPFTFTVTNPQPFTLLVWDLTGDFSPPSMSNPIILSGLPVGTDTLATVFYDINTQCYSFPSLTIFTVLDGPIADAGNDDTICPGFSAQLNGSGGVSYLWSPTIGLSVSDAPFTLATVSSTTTYTLTVTDINGCQSTDSVTVFVSNAGDCDTIIIWNGISPNGDGLNESWFIEGINNYRENKVHIFNRWGDKVWFTSDYDNLNNHWSGTNQSGEALPPGTYFFVIQYPPDKTRSGWVEITR